MRARASARIRTGEWKNRDNEKRLLFNMSASSSSRDSKTCTKKAAGVKSSLHLPSPNEHSPALKNVPRGSPSPGLASRLKRPRLAAYVRGLHLVLEKRQNDERRARAVCTKLRTVFQPLPGFPLDNKEGTLGLQFQRNSPCFSQLIDFDQGHLQNLLKYTQMKYGDDFHFFPRSWIFSK